MSTAMAGGWVRDGSTLRRPSHNGRGVETVNCGPGSWYTGEIGEDGEPVARGGTRSATAVPARSRRSAAKSISAVRFTVRALDELYGEVSHHLDGLEAGGGLYGYEEGGKIIIEGAGSPAPNAVRTSESTEIPHGRCLDQERLYVLRGSRARWVADWHIHPLHDSFTCSETDKRAWERGAQLVHDPYVGVIAFTGDDDGINPYYKPGLRAWVATTDGGVGAVPIEFEER